MPPCSPAKTVYWCMKAPVQVSCMPTFIHPHMHMCNHVHACMHAHLHYRHAYIPTYLHTDKRQTYRQTGIPTHMHAIVCDWYVVNLRGISTQRIIEKLQEGGYMGSHVLNVRHRHGKNIKRQSATWGEKSPDPILARIDSFRCVSLSWCR